MPIKEDHMTLHMLVQLIPQIALYSVFWREKAHHPTSRIKTEVRIAELFKFNLNSNFRRLQKEVRRAATLRLTHSAGFFGTSVGPNAAHTHAPTSHIKEEHMVVHLVLQREAFLAIFGGEKLNNDSNSIQNAAKKECIRAAEEYLNG